MALVQLARAEAAREQALRDAQRTVALESECATLKQQMKLLVAAITPSAANTAPAGLKRPPPI